MTLKTLKIGYWLPESKVNIIAFFFLLTVQFCIVEIKNGTVQCFRFIIRQYTKISVPTRSSIETIHMK